MVLLVALALLLAACGGDDDGGGGGGGGGNGDGGESVEGSTFTLEVPEGWRDESDEAERFSQGGFTPDVILVGDREEGVQANLNVIREQNIDPSLELEEYVEASRAQLQAGAGGLPGGEVGDAEDADLGGEEALALEYERELDGREVKFRQIYTIRDGDGYAVTLTSSESEFDEEVERFDEAVESWEWE